MIAASLVFVGPLGAQGTPTVTIVASDSLASEFSSGIPVGPLVPMVGYGDGEFTVRLSQRAPTAITVPFDVTGSARAKLDYADLGGSVTIPAGALSVVIRLTGVDDKDVEPDETIVVTLRSGSGYTVSGAAATVTLIDNDQAVELTASAALVPEPAGSTTVTARRLGTLRGTQVVRVTYSGTATRGTDYTAAADSIVIPAGRAAATFAIAARNDQVTEGTESIVVAVANLPMQPGPLSLQVTDAAITLSGPATPVAEVDGAPMTFVLTRVGGDMSAAATFSVTYGGSAVNGVDYQGAPTSITIPAGASSVTFTLTVRSDLAAEAAETIQVVTVNPSYTTGFFTASIALNGPLPTAVTVASSTIPFLTETTGTVTLFEPAIAGTTVTLSSSNAVVTLSDAAGALPFATQVTLPATTGATSVAFRARASNGTGSVVATLSAAPISATLTVSGVVTHAVGTATSPTSPVLDTLSIPSGNSRQGVIRLSAQLTSSAFFQLTSTSAAVQVPAQVTIAANTAQMPFNLVASAVTSMQQGLVIASRNGVADTMTVRVLPPVAVATISLPAQIASGASGAGSVSLNQPAPVGGAVVQLTSNSPNLALPASVTVAEYATSASFTATVPTFGAPANQQVQVSATSGGATVNTTLTLLPHALSLVLGPGPFGGQVYTFDVRLNRPAPSGGITATLSSSHVAFPLAASLTFASGDTSKAVTVNTQGVGSIVSVVITASFGASLAKNSVAVSPAPLSGFTIAPVLTSGAGATATGTVTLSGLAPPGGLQLNVVNANPTRAAVPSVVSIPASAGSAQFTMTTLPAVDNGDSGPVQVTVSTSFGQQLTFNFSAGPGVNLQSFSISPSTISAGGSVTGTVSLTQPAPAGGKSLAISVLSGATAVTAPSTVTVPQGASSTTFTITTLPNTGGQAVTISAGSRTASFTITP